MNNRDFAEYYIRQVAFAGIGSEGQARLASSCVAIVGCGGIGSAAAEQLSRAGVGKIKLIDRDYVEWNNLQRQVLFDEEDARRALPKAVAAARKLKTINSQVHLEPIVADLCSENVEELLEGADLIVDGTDNFETRYLLNDACLKAKRPWIYCAAVSSYGMLMPIIPGRTPCLKCLFPREPEAGRLATCATAGVINSITGLIASLATAEALKLLVESGKAAQGLISVDLWENLFEVRRAGKRSDCPACAQGRYEHLEARGEAAVRLCGRDALQVRPPSPQALDLKGLARRLRKAGEVEENGFLLRLRAQGRELVLFPDGRAIIKGTEDPKEARSFYAEYIGL